MDRFASLAYRPFSLSRSGMLAPWPTLLLGFLIAFVVATLMAVVLGNAAEPDALLGPIRWETLRSGAA